jgi:predicted RNase H-like HicB family nuclease
MEIDGKIWKDGKLWLIEIPALDAMTQGETRKEALAMAEDLVLEMARSYFKNEAVKDFAVIIIDYRKDVVGATANDNKLLLALSLRRTLRG